VAISFHFIDDNWNLCSPLIAFKQIIGSHTAEAVGGICAAVLQDFLADDVNPFSGVFDGGDVSSVQTTAEVLECHIEARRCVCHLLNNAIKKVINEHLGSKQHIEDWRCFVSRINFSNPCKETWDDICKATFGKTITLSKDCPTRWSSTITMLQSALQVKRAVQAMRAISGRHTVRFHFFLMY
jgi:hypothetical protein